LALRERVAVTARDVATRSARSMGAILPGATDGGAHP
jgi:hypothetical protein